MNDTRLTTIAPKTWSLQVAAMAFNVIRDMAIDKKSITSLDVKNALRRIVGPSIPILQTDVSQFLQAVMKDKAQVQELSCYRTKQMRSPSGAPYLEYYCVQFSPEIPKDTESVLVKDEQPLIKHEAKVDTLEESIKKLSFWRRVKLVFGK